MYPMAVADFAQRADAVIDTVGGASQAQLFVLAKPGGIIVSSVSQPSIELAQQHGVHTVFFVVDVNATDLARQEDMFEARELIAIPRACGGTSGAGVGRARHGTTLTR
jgi:NADPH:quinone reductase-like Zn-dependent oxidoreductase